MESTSASAVVILCINAVFVLVILVGLASAVKIVPEEKRLRIYRMGRYLGDKGPGLVLLIPFIDKGIMTDLDGQMREARRQAERLGPGLGQALTSIHSTGQVTVNGETWDAISREPIAAGEKVRIVRIVVEVERMFPTV